MKLSHSYLFLLVPLGLVSLISENILLGLLAVTVLGFGFALLWRPGESPILLFVFGYQWLQISLRIFQASFEGVQVDALSQFGGAISGAIFVALIGLLLLVLGIRLGAGPPEVNVAAAMQRAVAGKPVLYWFKLYVVALLFAALAQIAARVIPALSQLFLAFASFKWAFYLAFTYATFGRRNGPRNLWFLVFALELGLSFGAYFSDFRTILFMTIFALIPTGVGLTLRRTMGLACVAALGLALSVVWSSVKVEYRDFLNQGESAQIVVVEYGDSMSRLLELVGKLDASALAQGAQALVDRISYVDIFARTLDHVPSVTPHQDGAVWGDAVLRPFMPRIFFPEKSTINDSEFTNQFSGLIFATSTEGTSVSIGYMGEAYIDFGYIFMMVPIFLLGLTCGWFYKWISTYPSGPSLIGMGLATVVLYPAAQFETSITKLIGGLLASVLMAWVVARWAPRYMSKFEK
jgi:hypothetical protein